MSVQLVTGGSGYFGGLLVERLRRDGHAVRIFDINDNPDRPGDVEIIRADIRDKEAIARACQGVSTVFHNVAQVPLAKDRAAFWAVNRDGTENLLRACLDAGVSKVVNMSSSAVFGAPEDNPVTEATVPKPREDYGRAKLAAEEICWSYIDRGLDVTTIRPRTIMGHGRLGIMQILFEWVRRGRNIPVLGRGDNRYQFVHADDLARACLLSARSRGAAVYNIGAGRFCSMRETLEGLCDHARTGSRVRSVPMALASWGMTLTSRLGLSPLGPYHALMYGRSMYFDCDRAEAELGWKSQWSNIEMFIDSYEWYLAHRREVLGRTGGSHHSSPVKQGILDLVSRLL